MSESLRLHIAIEQIKFARHYFLGMLDELADDDWYASPPGMSTHIAWQVGHVAMAEYGLALFRVRGRQPEDLELMPSKFRKQFSRGSTPNLDREANPTPQELREILDRIHQQVLRELPTFSEEQLDEKIDPPHAVYDTKLGAVMFCSHHEMLHAGQVGLIRRALGREPIR